MSIRTTSTIEVIDLSSESEQDEPALAEIPPGGNPIRQQKEVEDPRLSYLKCVICLDSPTDLTATSCGHLFCHECITAALKVTSATSGVCPVCRRKVTTKSLIPLAIMKGSMLGSDVAVPKLPIETANRRDGSTGTPSELKAPLRRNSRRAASSKSIEL